MIYVCAVCAVVQWCSGAVCAVCAVCVYNVYWYSVKCTYMYIMYYMCTHVRCVVYSIHVSTNTGHATIPTLLDPVRDPFRGPVRDPGPVSYCS